MLDHFQTGHSLDPVSTMDVSNSSSGGRRTSSRGRQSSVSSSSSQQRHSETSAAAASSLQLLLREDTRLVEFGLTETKASADTVAFPYAAALLAGDDERRSTKARADEAREEVQRKLTLVESLAVKLSRTRPEAVAGHLLRLHGYRLADDDNEEGSGEQQQQVDTPSLSAVRERAARLERQAEVLDGIAGRVETSLTRGLTRMETACERLERVLTLSSTLKSILRLQFEANKLSGYDLEDVRDLTRAASSVAVLEELLSSEELKPGINLVDEMRPTIVATAKQVRESAATLLEEQYTQPNLTLTQLGATLQVYYNLGELPSAVWKAVDHAHAKAEAASRELFNAVTLVNLTDQAKRTAKEARLIQKKLKQIRLEAAEEWAEGMVQVTSLVRNLQRVLGRKTDPVSRQLYMDVVMSAPIPTLYGNRGDRSSIFALFWGRFCCSLSNILVNILQQDNGRYASDVAALYPGVRAASISLINRFQETLPGSNFMDDAGAAVSAGILGGSSLDDHFLQWTTGQQTESAGENPQAAADSWTRVSNVELVARESSQRFGTSSSSVPLSAVFQSPEWQTLQGTSKSNSGLYPIQQAFLAACTERLCAPLQYMFPENVTLDENGVAIDTGLALLPSKYDVQRFDENIRQELSLADPKEGGGDLTAVTMIAECVVEMIARFCDRARNAVSGVGEDGYVRDDWTMTDSLQHDRKVVAIMYAMAKYLLAAPEKAFVAPYRPATSVQHEEAAAMCQTALVPALQEIERMVKSVVLAPLCRALNRRIADIFSKVHHGVYIESGGGLEDESPAFVQKHLADIFEVIGQNHLSKFPPEYASIIASKIAAFSIYSYVSNVFLVRPLGENSRLHITQDLADLELCLEQLVLKNGDSLTLSQIDGGKPYAELRAVRQMLYWTGLESKNKSANDIAKGLLREVWIKDVRPTTVLHYLFSFAPSLLSSPHHTKRMRADDYVFHLVKLDGSVDDGEDGAWLAIMACCDSYQQRASSMAGKDLDGDARVAQTLMLLGQELLRRRRS